MRGGHVTAGGRSMRKVILQEFITLDGLAAGPNDSVDYVPASPKMLSVQLKVQIGSSEENRQKTCTKAVTTAQ